ncbi:conjugative transfer system coupling protein TraD [Colwellia sp. MSW7]|uniref:Conjugative transfer system coupling protein TraD n=1 Tax=Colwellia maritima TaxID=2912588 RepID=A0ABS9X761_9GAMM|nr:conjugative transfer system coupling protein TraD [Colwellia maritima]MCI2286057.1 conjugative transfer system coupling protein TraD [Colwellia maritima]
MMMREETEKLGGAPWIHGMGKDKPITTSEEAWYGHTLITGNVGTGKTTLLRLMSLNALHLGNVLVVVDPKDDEDWQKSIKEEMNYLGIGDKFFHLHPAKQNTSARIPLLKNFTRITEIADRVAPLMGSGGSSKPFQDFAYGIIYHTANALDFLGEPIRLTSIQKIIASDRKGSALRVLRKHFTDTIGEEWEVKYANALDKLDPDPLTAIAMFYNNGSRVKSKVVEGMIEFALHDEGHYAKMVVSLRPVLTALTAAPLDDLLSPLDDEVDEDERPMVDLADIMESGGCIYVSLDSLTDSTSAGFISRLLLAEMAAIAGERYNNGVGDSRRVTIANDEVHASLENNDALLNILAQGRAAKMQMLLATQTVADLEAKSDAATASRFLGLCNNFMSMRTTDPKTQEYVASQFSKSSVAQSQVQTATSSDTSTSIFEFGANHGERLMKQREDMFQSRITWSVTNITICSEVG